MYDPYPVKCPILGERFQFRALLLPEIFQSALPRAAEEASAALHPYNILIDIAKGKQSATQDQSAMPSKHLVVSD